MTKKATKTQDPTREALARSVTALEQERSTERAIQAAVDAWRHSRSPSIADLVDRLCVRRLQELEDDPAASRAMQRRPLGTSPYRTATALAACWAVIQHDDGADPEQEALTGEDPRLAQALFRTMFERQLFQGSFVRRAGSVEGHAERFATLGDVRFIEPLRTRLASPQAFPGNAADLRARPAYERALAVLEKRQAALVPVSEEALALLAQLSTIVPDAGPRRQAPARAKFVTSSAIEALNAVFAAPDDDSLRRICGDRLTELGDLRGEFISLQFAKLDGRLDAAGKKRMAALFHKNAGHWAGDVAPIGTREGMRFEKGFISHVTLDKSTLGLKREMWDAALESPYWATVVQLDISDRVPDWWLRAFLRSPRSATIRRLGLIERYKPAPCILLERTEGAATPFHLLSAQKQHKKWDKVLSALSASQLQLLLADGTSLELASTVVAPIRSAIAKLSKGS